VFAISESLRAPTAASARTGQSPARSPYRTDLRRHMLTGGKSCTIFVLNSGLSIAALTNCARTIDCEGRSGQSRRATGAASRRAAEA
jgi:hypothetical protein